jgi:aminopeptidase N
MDLYFERHDGEAVTCDDFAAAMEDASGVDLTQFRLWYSQAGTPQLTVSRHYDAAARRYRLDIAQEVPPTPGQPVKLPMHIPVRLGLIDAEGQPLPLKFDNRAQAPTEIVLDVTAPRQSIVFEDVPEGAVPSLLRGFSAPVRLEAGYSRAELAHLMRHDTDTFNRWEAGQCLALAVLLERIADREAPLDPLLVSSFAVLLRDREMDRALSAEALALPGEDYLAQQVEEIDIDAIYDARHFVRSGLARQLSGHWDRVYFDNNANEPYRFSAEAAGRRRLKNLALSYLMVNDEAATVPTATAQFRTADNMTDEQAALSVLSHVDAPERDEALKAFYEKWKNDPLVLDKWFAIQAWADRADTFERVKALLKHEAYEPTNPNRVRSLLGGFASNRKRFHDPSGVGYAFLGEQIAEIDMRNPRLSSGLVTVFESWRRFEPIRRAAMKGILEELVSRPRISKDLAEKVNKFLAGSD